MPMTPGQTNFPATISDMQDVYSVAASAPTPTPSRSNSSYISTASESAPSSLSSSFSFSRLLRKKRRADSESPAAPTPTPSTSSRSSIDSQMTLSTPTTPLSAPKPSPPSKDYEAAFGSLSSSYGFGAPSPTCVPILPNTSSTRTAPRRKPASSPSDTSSEIDEQTARLGKLLLQHDAGAEARFVYAATR